MITSATAQPKVDAAVPSWGTWLIRGTITAAVAVPVIAAARPGSLVRNALSNPHQAAVIASNPHRPWLARTAFVAHADALKGQLELAGSISGHIDDEVDAFRHAYGSGLLHLRLMRDHGVSERTSAQLVQRIGRAHERDGLDNPHQLSVAMDLANNDAGIALVGNGRTGRSTAAFLSDDDVLVRATDAVRSGQLVQIGTDAAGASALVPTRWSAKPAG